MLGVSGNLNVSTRCGLDQRAYQVFPVAWTITPSAHARHGLQSADRLQTSSDHSYARYRRAYDFSNSRRHATQGSAAALQGIPSRSQLSCVWHHDRSASWLTYSVIAHSLWSPISAWSLSSRCISFPSPRVPLRTAHVALNCDRPDQHALSMFHQRSIL